MRRIATIIIALSLPLVAQAEQQAADYSFISGDDLYDALSQDSMVLQGYILGVTDALKHSNNPAECFTIPLRPDADQVIYSAYLNYWQEQSPRPTNATRAISEMMLNQFPCGSEQIQD